MALSGHDIRMKEFRRARFRGYSEDDVDQFLMELALQLDAAMATPAAHASANGNDTAPVAGDRTPPSPDVLQDEDDGVTSITAKRHDVVAPAHAAPTQPIDDAVVERAEERAEAIESRAREIAEETIAQARAIAERGLRRARQRAEEILLEAQEQQQRAERTEAEAELRLAHVEQRLAEQAAVLAREARRLDELARWLSEGEGPLPTGDADPATPTSEPDDGEVVPLKRAE